MIWAPVICVEPPELTSIALPLVPVVVMTVGPIRLLEMVADPPFAVSTAKACDPAVPIARPAIVVDPPVEVMTPYI
jgi:hypothetical protein